jgi:hypothetical protein
MRPLAFAAFAVVLLLAAGCSRKDARVTKEPTTTQEAGPAEPVLAQSTATTPAPPTADAAYAITTTELRLGAKVIAPIPSADVWAHGLPGKYKRSGPNDLYVVPLANAAQEAKQKEAAIAFDGRVPYRLVVEVLFTLGQSEVTTYHLLVAGPSGTASIDCTPPRATAALAAQADAMQAQMLAAFGDAGAGKPAPRASSKAAPSASAPPAKPPLNLTVLITNEGIAVKGRGGNVAPGCADAGPGLTLPKGAGGHDFAGLTACVAKLAAQAPVAANDAVTVGGNPDIDFQTVVRTIDAVRPSFSRVQFGVPH